MEDVPYTHAEILAAGSGFPERGPLCERCRTHIPQFAELSLDDERRILALIHAEQPIKAMAELRLVTGCSIRWAKIWVLHEGKPHSSLSCPHCGMPLRSPKAKQCRYCQRDWHTK